MCITQSIDTFRDRKYCVQSFAILIGYLTGSQRHTQVLRESTEESTNNNNNNNMAASIGTLKKRIKI